MFTYTVPTINPRNGAVRMSCSSPTLLAGNALIAVSMFIMEMKLGGIKEGEDWRGIDSGPSRSS